MEFIAPAPAVSAASAPVVEYIAPEPANYLRDAGSCGGVFHSSSSRVTGSVRPCTDPKDAKKEKADEAGAVVPEATVNRRRRRPFEYEVKWHFKPIEANV